MGVMAGYDKLLLAMNTAQLTCFAIDNFPFRLVAARTQRAWMDHFPDGHAYRCLPLLIANSHGWEVLCPVPLEIEWDGECSPKSLTIRSSKALPSGHRLEHFARSNFGYGVVTLHVNYIFRTGTAWNLMATGPFNRPKENAYPLTGIIETSWLPYPFTMNWQVQRAGTVHFDEGEPFCSIFPIQTAPLVECQPEIRRISEDPDLERKYLDFRTARDEFLQRLNSGDPSAVAEAWQKHYFVGRYPDGSQASAHLSKLRLLEPLDRRESRT
jgi:hypothetical protein